MLMCLSLFYPKPARMLSGMVRAQAYLADAYSYWTQHINIEGDFDRQYLVRHLH